MASSSDSFNKSQQAAISYGMWWSRFSVNSRQMDICFLDHRMLSFKASHSLYISSFGKTKKKLFSHAAVGPLRSSKWKNLCNALFYYYYILCIICAKRKEKCFKRVCFVSLLSLEKENVGSQWTRKLQTHCQSIASIFHRPFGLTCFFSILGNRPDWRPDVPDEDWLISSLTTMIVVRLTKLSTRPLRCVLIFLTYPKTSMTPSSSDNSMLASIATYTPERPAPSLKN